MPSKHSKDGERDRDRDSETPKRKDKDRAHRSSRSSKKPSSRDRERDPDKPKRSSISRRSSMPIPELERRISGSSPGASKSSLPYPTFSKAHSKEAVGSRESVINPRMSLYTPDPTDLDWKRGMDGTGIQEEGIDEATGAPPSPPLTAVEPDVRTEAAAGTSKNGGMNKARRDFEDEPRPRSRTSKTSLRKSSKQDGGSRVSSSSRKSTPSTITTATPVNPRTATVEDADSLIDSIRPTSPTVSMDSVTETDTSTDSDATSLARNHHTDHSAPTLLSNADSSPNSYPDLSPRTPTQSTVHLPPVDPERKETPAMAFDLGERQTPGFGGSPMPPPPPPPPVMPIDVPRVDYLLQSGGLSHYVPRALLAAKKPSSIQPYQQYLSPQLSATMSMDIAEIFDPYNGLLDDYLTVLLKNGSVAVATGYRSVARRLLDRLEAVFARDISSETCDCTICQSRPPSVNTEEERGVNWGEVLELVSGRRELPSWPPFALTSDVQGLGISSAERRTPMQKLDIDVPEEYRDHYVRQSKKTKQTVDRWLASQPENRSSPPQEVDDEDLTFAILTHLESEQRPIYTSLLGVSSNIQESRAPTPSTKTRSELLIKTGLALQRLYRLSSPPRDPESAIFLLNNPSLHNALATLTAITSGEWEVLTSGRFDGFLWSGAETTTNPPSTTASPSLSRLPSRGPTPLSRTTTPFSNHNAAPSRGTTPFTPSHLQTQQQQNPFSRQSTPFHTLASAASRGTTPAPTALGAPVPLDEETEIAVLAEVEREIYMGMEALEDAFEALHRKAEIVRRALRERGAGLSCANQARKNGANGEGGGGVEVRMGTPASAAGWESETDDGGGGDDGASELAPDDSASNISSSRIRRPKRRNERRTPALVEEEEEEEERERERVGGGRWGLRGKSEVSSRR
ncbi:MAG: hypothetical protein M1812_007442 [Candelaria pacifica]|nr:MAG: hypothetical protein M1812_007442 [Candelaria pacifica]